MSLVISKVFTYDTDAGNYIQAVEAADGQALEAATRQAINNFVIGCKQDGIWDAFEQCGVLCGARTKEGAVIPLKKPSSNANPTFAGTSGGWTYARKTGLSGNGTDNYVDTKYIIPAGNQNNIHMSIWRTTTTQGGSNAYHIGTYTSGFAVGSAVGNGGMYSNSAGFFAENANANNNIGLHAHTRIASGSVSFKRPGYGVKTANSLDSSTPPTVSMYLFTSSNNGTPGSTNWSSAPLGFYSVGKNLSIDTLNSRVTDLITAIGAAF